MSPGIAAWGVAIPVWRLDRAMHGRAWDTPALPGKRSVAGGDEDSLTLAVAAALEATRSFDPSRIDWISFSSTTPPYAEKHGAATIAAVLGREDARTADVTGSTRAATSALRAAIDAVAAGSARAALVAAADMRPAEPASVSEQLFGDGAAAVVVSADGPVQVAGAAAVAEEFTGPWRRADAPHVTAFDGRLESEHGHARPVERAVSAALADAGISADAVTRFASYAPDPRTWAATAKRIGLAAAKDPLFETLGNLGAAHALVALAGALDEAAPGEHIVLAASGEGADALVLAAGRGIERSRAQRPLRAALGSGRDLASYERFLRFRSLLGSEPMEPPSSTIRTWRDRAQAFRLEGVRCDACGTVQFPANRACISCSALDRMSPVRLARTGTVFTFTLDHLISGEYLETPVPRAVVDLDGGGRVFVELTDCVPEDVRVGMRVELVFRLMHRGAGFNNYYWKGRPA